MNHKKIFLTVAVVLCGALLVMGQSFPNAKRVEDEGFSPERLERIGKFFRAEADKKAIPGATVLMARDSRGTAD